MTRRARRLLFIWAVALFVLISTSVLVFAFGFRYDFKTNSLVKTGSIVLKPNVDAQIFINNKLEGNTSFLNSTFSKSKLLPGIYTVKITKDHYFTWEKKVEVKEGLVSDFPHIVLFNQNPVKPSLAAKKAPFSFDKSSGEMVYLEKDILSFYNLNEKQPAYQSESIPWDPATLKIIWGKDGREIVVYDKTRAAYFNLDNKTAVLLGSPKQFNLSTAILYGGQLYFLKSTDLRSLSLSQLKTSIISKNIISFLVNKNEIWAISGTPPPAGGRFLKMNLDGTNENILGKLNSADSRSLVLKKVENRNESIFVLIGSNLYTLKDNSLTLNTANANDFSISPNGNILGWTSGRYFWIEWLKDTDYQPLKKVGEKELVATVARNITRLSWYRNEDYAFLESEGNLSVAETDLRGGANNFSLLNLESQEQAWYDLNQNKIFKLNRLNGLAVIDLP